MKDVYKTKAQLIAELEDLRQRVVGLESAQDMHRSADRKAEERRMYLEGILNAVPDAIVTLDTQQCVVEWNPGAERLFGYSPQEAIGRNLDDLVAAPDVWQEAIGFTRSAFNGESVGPVETVRYRRDGSPVHVLVAGSPILVGKEVVGLVAVYTDISERKWAENALLELNVTLEAQIAERTAEMRAEKEKSEAVLRSVADAILVVDGRMQVKYVNPAFVELTGFQADEVVGLHARDVGAGIDPPEMVQAIESAMVTGGWWQGEVRIQRKDGRTYDAALVIAPLRDAAGRVQGFVSSHRDISRLKQLDRARSRFMANVSHQLRTPVTNLRLYARLMRRGLPPEGQEHCLQVIEQQADRLTHMIENILDMAELDSGRAAVDRQAVSVARLLDQIVTRYRRQAQEANLRLSVAPVPPDAVRVEGDAHWLTLALAKLVENAVAFTPSGGQVTIEAGMAEKEGRSWVTVTVRDTGPGITPQEQERIFGRLQRGSVADSGHIPGTGLGLSIVQEIALIHGGRVTVKSQVGQGSAFTLWLPAVQAMGAE